MIVPNPSDTPIRVQTTTFYQGDVPHPEIMRGLQQVDPSFPERIMKMTEEALSHRLSMGNKILDRDTRFKTRGQWFTVLLFAMVLGLAALCIVFDKEVASVDVVVSGFGAIAVAAIKGVNGR
ncbi:hypothetical protein AGMMS49938_03840 [Fibrobacterales bacterium]|nr:hypothetical protein AGMMS49938_03840 [Fibrobacterales bacterium]